MCGDAMTEKSTPLLAPALAFEPPSARVANGEPSSYTQADGDVLAKGGQDAQRLGERLARERTEVRAVSEKDGPTAIDADEMAAIIKMGKLPAQLEHHFPAQQPTTARAMATRIS